MHMSRPRILLSECLGFRPVRYDGNIVFDVFVESLKKYVDTVPVCPEVGIGLGVPRNPLILYLENNTIELIDTVTGSKYTKIMVEYADKTLRNLDVDGAILKSSSPSCGVGDAKVYDKHRAVVKKSNGLFTQLLREKYPCLPVESEKRLYNYSIRRAFLTKIFSLAELRETLLNMRSREELVTFHRRYKYILMLYSQTSLKKLGRLIASRSEYELHDLAKTYRDEFLRAMCRSPTRKSYVNVLLHMYSHLKNNLKVSERKFILELVNKYRVGSESLRVVLEYFRGFIYRFDDTYLSEQKFFYPYPEELDYIGLEQPE